MAAGPNRLATNYLERLDNIEEIVEELDYRLTYEPGWDVLEEMSEWQDIAKGIDKAKARDLEMSKARKRLDWEKQIELAIDPKKAKQSRAEHNQNLKDEEACTMCGSFCAMKIVEQAIGSGV